MSETQNIVDVIGGKKPVMVETSIDYESVAMLAFGLFIAIFLAVLLANKLS